MKREREHRSVRGSLCYVSIHLSVRDNILPDILRLVFANIIRSTHAHTHARTRACPHTPRGALLVHSQRTSRLYRAKANRTSSTRDGSTKMRMTQMGVWLGAWIGHVRAAGNVRTRSNLCHNASFFCWTFTTTVSHASTSNFEKKKYKRRIHHELERKAQADHTWFWRWRWQAIDAVSVG